MTDIADFLGGQPPLEVNAPQPGRAGAFTPGAVMSLADFQGEGQVQNYVPESEPEKLNFIQRFQEDIDRRVMMFAEIQKATEEGDQSMGEAIFQTAGKVGAGAILDFISEGLVSAARGVSFITPDVIEDPMKDAVAGAAISFLDTEVGKAGLEAAKSGFEAWDDWSAQHPRAARSIESVVNIGALIAPVKGKPSARPVSGPTAPPRINLATGLPEAGSPANTALGRTADRLTRAADAQTTARRQEFAEQLIQPKPTARVRQEQVARSSEQGVLRSRVVEPSPAEARAAAEVVNIPDVKPSQSLLANANVIRRELSDEAENLRTLLDENPVSVSPREVEKSLELAQQRILDQPLIVGNAARVSQRLVNEAQRIVGQHPNTSSGLLQARKEFDRFVETQRGGSVFDPALENATSIAVREVRQTLNNIIAVKNPSVGVRESLGRQSNLFVALDNMTPKIADMYNNAALRLWQNAMRVLPFRGEFNQLMATVAGVGGLGASAAFAPMFTTLAGLGLGAYAGTKLVTAPGAKRALAGLIRQTDSALKTATDPVMISNLRADRALVLELMRKGEEAVENE